MRAALPLVAFAVVTGVSCAPPLVSFNAPDRAVETDSYTSVQQRWTREAKGYAEFDVELAVRATMQSWDFRQAYVAEYAKRYRLGDAERRSLADAEARAARERTELVVSFFTPDIRRNDLDSSGSAWRVRLGWRGADGAAGGPLAPKEIGVAGPPAVVEAFFPHHTAFTKSYRIVFDKPLAALREVWLDVAGPKSAARLTWTSGRD